MTEFLHRGAKDSDVLAARKRIPGSRLVRKIIGQQRDGFWPPQETCYRPKWTSAVWQLMLLAELAVPPDDRIMVEVERFLDLHQLESGSFACPSKLEEHGKRWDEPCLTGNMIRTLITLGYANDRRVKKAIDWLPVQQLEDGGWNCDYPEKKVKHSSFMSTIEPLWAYSEIPRSKWTRRMKRSVENGAEFLLMHHLFKSDNHHWRDTYPFFTRLHFPMYYFYDVLHGLRVLTKLGYADDERTRSAVHVLLSKRRPDGRWNLEGDWFREADKPSPERRKAPVKVEEIGKPSKWVTLNAFKVLAETGDVKF